jgi:hypothetical protein
MRCISSHPGSRVYYHSLRVLRWLQPFQGCLRGANVPPLARTPRILSFLLFGLLFTFLSGCTRRTVAVLENRSAATLTEITLSGKGFSFPLGAMNPGERRAVPLDLPSSEQGHLSITFLAAGTRHESSFEGYYEATGYEVRVHVRPDLTVSTTLRIRAP